MVTMPAGPVSRPWQRFLRFSVRALIFLVIVSAVGLGWLVHNARTQREAVKAIANAGGRVLYDWQWSDGKSIPGGKPWVPEWLVNSIGVDYFGHVTWVGFLPPSRPTDATAGQIGHLYRLQRLNIGTSSLSDAGIAHLERLTNLSYLFLQGNEVTDGGLSRLKRLTKLNSLDLTGTQVTDAGLVHLQGMTKLTRLTLQGTQVTDAGLSYLKRLTDLRELNIIRTPVTDAGLEHLKGLTKLTELYLFGTQVTDAGVRELQRALPTLKIDR